MKKIYLISSIEKDIIAYSEEDVVYKIGITEQENDARLKQLLTGTDKDLKIVKEFESNFPFKVETALHNHFKNKKINREWFDLNFEDVERFLTLCQRFETNFKILSDAGNPFI